MRSDTKIGLLLGLLFIFVIAFLINGLPSFKSMENDGNELLTNMVSMDANVPSLAQREQHARALLPGLISSAEGAVQTTQDWPLNAHAQPKEPPRTVMDLSAANQASHEGLAHPTLSPVARQTQEAARVVLKQHDPQSAPRPRIHIVKEGETLATIAQLVYGPEQGNRRQVVQQLYEANRKELKSPDCIYVGQKLVIPALPQENQVISAATFVPVRSSATSPVSHVDMSQPSWYQVKDGDSLWKIANQQLGNGNRYPEIVKLNRKILGDEDEISVGMRLRLPSKK